MGADGFGFFNADVRRGGAEVRRGFGGKLDAETLSNLKNYIRVFPDFMKSLYKSSINLRKLYIDPMSMGL